MRNGLIMIDWTRARVLPFFSPLDVFAHHRRHAPFGVITTRLVLEANGGFELIDGILVPLCDTTDFAHHVLLDTQAFCDLAVGQTGSGALCISL